MFEFIGWTFRTQSCSSEISRDRALMASDTLTTVPLSDSEKEVIGMVSDSPVNVLGPHCIFYGRECYIGNFGSERYAIGPEFMSQFEFRDDWTYHSNFSPTEALHSIIDPWEIRKDKMMRHKERLAKKSDSIVFKVGRSVRHETRWIAERNAPFDQLITFVLWFSPREWANPSVVLMVVPNDEKVLFIIGARTQVNIIYVHQIISFWSTHSRTISARDALSIFSWYEVYARK